MPACQTFNKIERRKLLTSHGLELKVSEETTEIKFNTRMAGRERENNIYIRYNIFFKTLIKRNKQVAQ